jgi:dTDP-4-amino-4,6-dideoxygalactose transaminase
MIPLFKVKMSPDATTAVGKVLNSGFIGQGKKVDEFEELLKQQLLTETTPVTVNSCTSAIDLALELCGVGPGDEVIVTPQTCFASNIGPIHRGARIRWADIDPITGLIQVGDVERLITDKTKAIIAVNWAGKFCDYKRLKQFGIPVIEDAAHTWKVFYTDKEPERGDYVCYSFQAIKYLTTGDGGALVCPNAEKEKEARILRWYGLDRTKSESFRCTQNITQAGFKYHMNDINASIGIANFQESIRSVLMQRENTKFIIDNVKNDKLILPTYDNTCSYWLFSMHVIDGTKREFIKYLESSGIASSPVHFRNDKYDCTKQFEEGELYGVTSFDQTQICIPNGWWLDNKDLEHIVDTLNKY